MRKLLRCCLAVGISIIAGSLSIGCCFAQASGKPVKGDGNAVKRFLQEYLRDPQDSEAMSTRYVSTFVDLQDNGIQDVIVYLMDDGWCGSGGCTMLLLTPTRSSYRVMRRFTITRTPIRVLSTKSHGWHDIGVWVQGGGILPGYEARLSFNGKTYPSNPSVPPARRLTRTVPGKVVVPDSALPHAMPLYP